MTADEYHVEEEQLAYLKSKCVDKAQKRLEGEIAVRIFKRLDDVEPTQFVIVNPPGHTSAI